MSRIEQLITEIEEYIDSCKFQPLSTTKIIVNKEELDELLDRMSPEQIEALKERIHAMESEEAKPEEEGAHE